MCKCRDRALRHRRSHGTGPRVGKRENELKSREFKPLLSFSSSIETLIPDSQQCPTTNAPPSDLYGAVGGVHDGFFVICGGMLKGGKPRDVKI